MFQSWRIFSTFGLLLVSVLRLSHSVPFKVDQDSDQVNTIGEQGKAIEDVNSFEKDDSGHFDSKDHFEDSEDDEREVILDRIARVNDAAINPSGNEVEINELKDVVLHEGDMVINDTDYNNLLAHDERQTKRLSVRLHKSLWTSKIIPYEIDPKIPSGTADLIKKALENFEDKTCLTFTPRTRESNWIRFVSAQGCWSYVGRQSKPGAQHVSIGVGCELIGIIEHEIMHALGFHHEQSRPDRNSYISVLWENIKPGSERNFRRYSRGAVSTLGLGYDYGSVMHYGTRSFSKNGKPTIRAMSKLNSPLGQRVGLSNLDYMKVNVLYDCSFNKQDSWSKWSLFSPCNKNCWKIRQRFCYSKNPGHCNGALPNGVQAQALRCPPKECYAPVDGHWGRWSRFTPCTASCGIGVHRRSRLCNDPSPANGGKACPGDSAQVRACKLRICNKGPYDCDFTDNTCSWQQSKKDNFDWTRGSEGTPSFNTGPDWDNTGLIPGVSESYGYFMYIEASGRPAGYRARLTSSDFKNAGTGGSSPYCLSFFYHMYGSRIGLLRIYVTSLNGQQQALIWSKSGNQGQQWQYGKASFAVSGSFRIVFEGIRGLGFTSDIAIDDISVKNYKCGTKIKRSSSTIVAQSIIKKPQPASTSPTSKPLGDNKVPLAMSPTPTRYTTPTLVENWTSTTAILIPVTVSSVHSSEIMSAKPSLTQEISPSQTSSTSPVGASKIHLLSLPQKKKTTVNCPFGSSCKSRANLAVVRLESGRVESLSKRHRNGYIGTKSRGMLKLLGRRASLWTND